MDPLSRAPPSLVASTEDIYCCSINESRAREAALQNDQAQQQSARKENEADDESNHFKSAQWTADGTTLITSSADDTIRTFILPPTLLESDSPITLTPYTIHTHATTINCLTPYPYFELSEPTTTLYLSASTDLPIRLTNCLSPSPIPISTYNLISPTTEAYLTPSSILWPAPGTHFLTGTDCLIALFDISRTGEGPVTRLPTIPSKRHKMKGGGVGMRGIVSALSVQPSSAGEEGGILAAGTWTRWVGLYDGQGMGGTVATWSIAEAANLHAGIGGSGVTQTLWSNCGRYLYVAERKSKGILVFDVRVTGRLVAWLEGREADTNQRLGVDTFEAESGVEVWAGGSDGLVRVWERVGKTEGAIERSWEFRAHDDPVSSTVVHSSGTVVATSSGQRYALDLISDDETTDDESGSEADSDRESEESDSGSSKYSENNNLGDSSISEKPRRILDNSIKVWKL